MNNEIEVPKGMEFPPDGSNDPVEAAEIAKTVKAMAESAAAAQAERLALFLRWLELPNVTLDQAAWLLLGHDPELPPLDRPLSTGSPAFLHKRLVNRLESAIAEGKLKPIRPFQKYADRFSLLRVAAVSRDAGMTRQLSEEIRLASVQPKQSKKGSDQPTLERLEWHRLFVKSLPERLKSIIGPKPKRKHPRRRHAGEAVNVHVAMQAHEYNKQFLESVRRNYGIPTYHVAETMLANDRQALNITLPRGRPRDTVPEDSPN